MFLSKSALKFEQRYQIVMPYPQKSQNSSKNGEIQQQYSCHFPLIILYCGLNLFYLRYFGYYVTQ